MLTADGKKHLTDVAKHGGEVARNARIELEAKTGEKAITALNAKQEIFLKSNKE
jgi:hypothetical protein